ncbi:MAG: hypothetical protein Q4G31_03660 [bacterium]|nr:hypothetical protein [bacterium]
MAKEKKVKEKVALDPFTEWAHKSGRVFMVLFIAYMLVIPFIVCTVYDCMPSFKMCLPGLIAITAIMGPASIAEVGSYTPILGSSTYLTFASGNVMNLKIPCIINAQQIAKVEPNTVEGDAIALIATAVSSAVTIIILAIGVVLLSFIKPVLENPYVVTASDYLLPALFGCMALGLLSSGNGKTKVKNHLLPALVPALLVTALTVLGIGSTGLAGILIIVMIPVTILCARILWKKGIVKVVPVEQKETAASAQE